MDNVINKDFHAWVNGLASHYRSAQIKAAVAVNSALIRFYFDLGKEIHSNSFKAAYGNRFYEVLSKELIRQLPNVKGLSPRNIRYAESFYALYKCTDEILPQVVAELSMVPWGHHRLIIDKCKSPDAALFYVRKVVEGNWSRSVLENHLSANLYGRKGKAVSNFSAISSLPSGALAQEVTKDPYNFDFIAIREDYDEKQLKDALVNNVQRFLLELGSGFAFISRETRMFVGETELFDDLLFYHVKLHAYVAIEVKTRKFDPRDLGQLSAYVAAVNHQYRGEGDAPTIGLLICKGKDDVLVRYCLENYQVPLGVSEYDLTNLLPSELKSNLPTIEEIENEVKSDD